MVTNTSESGVLTLNRSSQVTLPKALRELLGVELGSHLAYRRVGKRKQVVIEREPTFAERMDAVRAKIDARLTPEERALRAELIEKNRGKTASELRDEWDRSPEGRAYYHEKYGAPLDDAPEKEA